MLKECGHEVLVADPRLVRVDPKLLYPLEHRGESSQAHLARSITSEEQSNPSGHVCPSVRLVASTRRRTPSTYQRNFSQLSSPFWRRYRS